MGTPTRRGAPRRDALAVLVGVSLAVHILAITALVMVSRPGARPPEPAPAEELSPRAECAIEALLSAGARAALCRVPHLGEGIRCADDPVRDLELALAQCRGRDGPERLMAEDATQLAQVDPEDLPDLEAASRELPDLEEEAAEDSEEDREQPPPIDRSAQVVETPESTATDERPDDARFLAEHDSVVDEEQVARGSTEEMAERPGPGDGDGRAADTADDADPEPRVAERPDDPPDEIPDETIDDPPDDVGDETQADPAGGEPEEPQAEPPSPEQSDVAGEGSEDREPREVAMREPPADERPGVQDEVEDMFDQGEVPILGDGGLPDLRELMDQARGGPGEPAHRPESAPDLRPTEQMLAEALGGGGGSVDHLEGVQEGESTALNAAQWKHASFFNRVKREVARDWDPVEVYRRHDPEGSRFSLRRRVTVVRVWLDEDGSLDRVGVLRGSGIEPLDDEAMRAFRAAAPFPNPPAELVEPDTGTLSFRFGFHFDARRPGLQDIFRR